MASARVTLLLLVVFPAVEALAQASVTAPSIFVTGSRLPRTDTDTLSPVTTFARDQIERSGFTTAGELFLTLPLNNGGAPNVNNGDGLTNPGYAGVSLRGIGTNATLVLVNGRRLAPYGFSGAAVDLNSIPVAAIERIEILRDGASALYGADAIAGVVNFILRSDYTGSEARVGGGFTTAGGAGAGQATASAGGASNGFGWMVTLDYRENAALGATQRSFSRTAYLPEKGIDYTSPIGFPGGYSFDLTTPFVSFSSAGLDCSPARFPGAIPIGDNCNYNYVIDSYIVPKSRKASGFGRVTWNASPDVQAYAEVLLTSNTYRYSTSATPVWGGYTPSATPFVLPATSPYNTFDTDVQFWWRTAQLGPRIFDVDAISDRLVGGVTWAAGPWALDTAAGTSGSRSREHLRTGYISDARLREVLANGGRINPFGETLPEDLPVLESLQVSGLAREATSRVSWVDAKGVTDWGSWQGRPIRLAVGTEARWERLQDTPGDLLRTGDLLGTAATQAVAGGHRTVASAYGEALIPALSNLELQLGARTDWYSDFGYAFSPRIGALWTPAPWGSVRSSFAKSFRAPNLPELYTEQVRGLTGPLDDPVRCPGGVAAPGANPQTDCLAQFGQIGGGNPQLKPERATNWLAGLVLRPNASFNVAATFWHIEKTNNVGILFDSTILDPLYYPELSQFVLRRPASASDIANGLPGPIEAVFTNNQNLGAARYAGWDFELTARMPGPFGGSLEMGALGVLMTEFRQQLQPGTEFVDFLGQSLNGTPVQRRRANAYVQWTRGEWGLGANAVYIGSYQDENPGPDGTFPRVASWFTLGFQGSYVARGWEIRAGVQNLFNRVPPFSNKSSAFTVGWDDLTHDPRGRLLYGSVSYSFR